MQSNITMLLLEKARQHKAEGRRGDEEACLQQVLKHNPNDREALTSLADIRISQQKYTAALALNHSVLRMYSNDSVACVQWAKNTALCYINETDHQAWSRVIAFQPYDCYTLLQYSNYWFRQDDFETAYLYVKRASELDDVMSALAMAKTLCGLRRLEESEKWFEKALATCFEGDRASYNWEHAMLLLLMGQLERGWEAYEARLQAYHPFNSGLQYYPFPFENWQGQSLKNKTILVHGEQGLGDEIMFGSMVRDLVRMKANVLLACAPSLTEIFARSFPEVTVYSHPRGKLDMDHWNVGGTPSFLSSLQDIDYQSPLGSLAKWLRPNISAFNSRAKTPYLKASRQKSNKYKKAIASRIRPGCQYKVGLVWTGNLTTGTMGEYKSIPLPELASLTRDEVQFISLQNAQYGQDFDTVPALNIMDFCEQLVDFDETAALIDNCDLVISVDTSVCHLSGAMGKKTWVPLRFSADWRYVAGREDSLWYQNTRLFRQQVRHDWSTVIVALGQALDEWLQQQKEA